MAEQRIHYLALKGIEERVESLRAERESAAEQLQEALAMGDLRENSEYDAAREQMQRIVRELDSLTPSLGLQPIKANPNARVIEEGCVIRLRIYSVTQSPINYNPGAADSSGKIPDPIFDGLLMYGGTVPGQDLLQDHALDVTTPIGRAILGKQPGNYSVQVPGGHANLVVEKVVTDPETGGEVTPETLKRSAVFVQ